MEGTIVFHPSCFHALQPSKHTIHNAFIHEYTHTLHVPLDFHFGMRALQKSDEAYG